MFIASVKIMERELSNSPSSVCGQLPDYYSHLFYFVYQVDEFSFREMRTWSQSKISYSCICVWYESGELGRRRISRFPCATPVVETCSSDRVTSRILPNIIDGAHLRKQPTTLHVACFCKKAPPQTYNCIPNTDLTEGAPNIGCG